MAGRESVNSADIPSILTGAGGTAGLGLFYLRNLLKEKAELLIELKQGHDREREMAERCLEAILLNKSFMEQLGHSLDLIKDELTGGN